MPLSALLVLAGAIGLVIGVAATLTLARTDRRLPGPVAERKDEGVRSPS